MARRFADLSHELVAGMTTYPGLPGPVIRDHLSWEDSRDHYAPGVEFQIGHIEMVSNTGTYMDTPAHRYRGGFDLSGLPLESAAGIPGVLVDAVGQAVDVDSFDGVEVSGRAVVVRTGWARHWGTDRYGAPEHPYVTADAARLLVASKATVVGIDSVNIDDTSPDSGGQRPAHSELLAAEIPIVEHLCGLEQLGEEAFTFFAVPVKVRGMATFPVRAFAALPD